MGGQSALFQWRQLRNGGKEGTWFKRTLESLLLVYPAGSPLFCFLSFLFPEVAPLSPMGLSINNEQGQWPHPRHLYLCWRRRGTQKHCSWTPFHDLLGTCGGGKRCGLWGQHPQAQGCHLLAVWLQHIIKLPEITSSSVKQGKTHLLHRVLLRILR